ncbi:hypothetical protein EGI16_12165 [Chryseobacterium sp. G0240]|uniref:hypothetical protein n=1 Tax=Chryseobacterium sp. G0240 TaxID=2487066 RepID=UPI000F44D4DE|nr:hypothetical protein [Chryseobacterium sp. G0240]ROI02920.1 hypothetical protein EGI16_12165 [Chryseobacterium sp. G0240]
MTKEEKIKEAYLGLGLPFSENILFDNGWLKIKPTQYQSKYQDVDLLKLTNHVHSIRPKSLQGIENNNGWIKIDFKSDIPMTTKKELNKDIEYHVIMGKDNSVFYESLKLNEVHSFYDKGWITHYQPIEKPKPPIY